MYSKMADGLEVFFPLCVYFIIIGYTSVVTAPVNVVMDRNTVGVESQLRILTKDALKSGKIKLETRNVDCENVNNANGDRLMAPEFWNTFMDSSSDWSEFEKHERQFRLGLSTKPIDDVKPFVHPTPELWFKIISLLSSLFIKDGVFREL